MIEKVWLSGLLIVVCCVKLDVGDYQDGDQEDRSRSKFPVLTSANLSYSVIVGSRTLLECQVDNLGDKFVVLWRKGDRILSVGTLLVRKDGKVGVTDNYSLELRDIDESDAGQYSCQLDVFGHTQTVLHNLTVLVPAQIHAWERTLEVTAGDDLNIICEASGNPVPRVTWKKYETGKEMLGDRVVLTNITRTDDGLYVCTADNGVTAPVERVTRILVRHAPEVSIEETWRPIGDKFEVQLVCHVRAYPSAKISWYKNGSVKLSMSDEIVIKANQPKYILRIEKLKPSNFGSYTCRASSELGTAKASIDITGKPRPPIFSSEMREILGGVTKVNISWSCDSLSPVTQYYLKYRHYKLQTESQNTDYKENIVICDPRPSPVTPLTQHCWHTLANLSNDTLYDVKLVASNVHGDSAESKVFSFFVAGGVKPNSKRRGKSDKNNGKRKGRGDSDISPRQLLRKDISTSDSQGRQLVLWLQIACASIVMFFC